MMHIGLVILSFFLALPEFFVFFTFLCWGINKFAP
jgi:hypothetical protein